MNPRESTSISATWHDVDPALQAAQQAKKEIEAPLTLENFIPRLNILNENEITDFIKTLSSKNQMTLAKKYFDPALHNALLQMSSRELRLFLMSTFLEANKKAQQETPLIDRPQVHDIISQAFLEKPAPIEAQGLRNGGVDCYLSSALQCLRQHVSNLPEETRQALLASLRTRYAEYLHTLP